MCTAPRPLNTITGYVHNLGGLAQPCTLGVRFRVLAWHLTPSWGLLWCKRHFCTPTIWMCTVPRPRASTTAYVYNLRDHPEPCKLGVPFWKHARHYGDHPGANGIFVHPLCGCVQLHDCMRSAAAIGCVHKLSSQPAPGTLGVRLQKHTWHLTPPLGPLWCKRHFRTPAVCMCTPP